ncbi:hypothetical protein JG688_00000583 [Phytophthora aleatoria]|uniref:Anaphase-promoting complex subunit 4-like WD40 domain-containing protein n=1 Tax=Phytophthora aleatoria TaxID=2496075 RepID=A0A8J5J7T6_9STRA|nr:hypothetical protein JG688_00000583 [Phytophthora aleatoria]
MAITSDEVNFLVYRYLQESGFLHSAFTFAYESQLAKSSVINTELPPGALVSFMQKGLQYVGIEAHINEDGTERECDGDFSLLSPHICRVAQSASSSARSFKASNKRKRKGDGSPDAVDEMNGVDKLDKEALVLLSGHEKEVYACSWNPVKNILVSGSSDSTARVWSLPNKVEDSKAVKPKVLSHGTGPHKDVTTLEWNHNGSLLASGTYNGKTRIWDAEGEMKHIFQYHNGPVFATRWSKTSLFLLSASFDKTVVVWDATTETKKQQLELHDDPILDASWKDDATFATCSSDMSICVARVGETKADVVLRGHKDAINSVKWDPAGRYLASCSDDYTVKIWDPSKAIDKKNPADGDAMEVDSSENNKKDAELDEATSAALVYTLQEHKKEVYTFRWSCTGPGTSLPDQPLTLASASFDGTVKLWDAESGSCRRTFDHQYPVYGVAFSPDGKYLASGTVGGMVNVWSLKDGSLVKTYQANGDIYEVNWNKEGDQIAACVSSGDNLQRMISFDTFSGPRARVREADLDSEGLLVLAEQPTPQPELFPPPSDSSDDEFYESQDDSDSLHERDDVDDVAGPAQNAGHPTKEQGRIRQLVELLTLQSHNVGDARSALVDKLLGVVKVNELVLTRATEEQIANAANDAITDEILASVDQEERRRNELAVKDQEIVPASTSTLEQLSPFRVLELVDVLDSTTGGMVKRVLTKITLQHSIGVDFVEWKDTIEAGAVRIEAIRAQFRP